MEKKKDNPTTVAKIKVSDLAKELGLASKDLLQTLKDLGVAAKTAASSIDAEAAQVVREINAPKAPVPEPKAPTPMPPIPEKPKVEGPIIDTPEISVKDLADKIAVKASDLIKELMKKGIFATINQRINADMACEVSTNLGKKLTTVAPKKKVEASLNLNMKNLVPRPPIVTIMGHVDHGKTKLLDAIRKTKVAEGEAGGITQHIGASQVEVHGKKVTFLDTPGHEAFTALRARGAKVTDIAVLVVAADDGVMPQTIEAIDHAKAAGVPIIVAINKIDKPDANPDRVKQQLADLGLAPEDWGGKTVMVPTSARQGTGISEILEMILLVAEVQELKADPHGTPVGVVIEARLDKGRGPVADVLIKNGTLKIGDVFTIGSTWGKVRALLTSKGERISKAGPSTPVEVLGSIDVPIAGDLLQVVAAEKEARLLAEKRKESASKTLRGKALSLEDFSKHVKEGEKQDLFLVVKADVQGSMDAIVRSIQNLTLENIRINIIHQGVGAVTESDIMLAKASNAIIINFNGAIESGVESMGQQEGVEIRTYNIIYKLIDDVKLAMEGMLEPEYEEVLVGKAEVRNLFKFSKVGTIAGCFVTEGKLTRGFKMHILRDKKEIYNGKLESLKRFKEDVKTVEQNFECGIAIVGYDDFKVGDIIEVFETREKARKK
jgi:translation initiation factor IF-2